MFGAERFIFHLHVVTVHQCCPAGDDGDTSVDQQLVVDAVEATDFTRPVGLEHVPVKDRRFPNPAKAVRLLKGFRVVRRIAVEFFRNTTDVDAGAAHGGHLGKGNTRAALRRHACGTYAAAAAANDK